MKNLLITILFGIAVAVQAQTPTPTATPTPTPTPLIFGKIPVSTKMPDGVTINTGQLTGFGGTSLPDQQVAFGNGTGIEGDSLFLWNKTNHALTIDTITLNATDVGEASFLGGDLQINGGNGGDGHIFNPGGLVQIGDANLDFSTPSVVIEDADVTLGAFMGGQEVFVSLAGGAKFEVNGKAQLDDVLVLVPNDTPDFPPVDGMIFHDAGAWGSHYFAYRGTYGSGGAWVQLAETTAPTPTPTATPTPTPTP